MISMVLLAGRTSLRHMMPYGSVGLPIGVEGDNHMNPTEVAVPLTGLAGEASGSSLRGRHRECAVVNQLVASLQAGRSGVLVLRGEAGAGKTALLTYLLDRASGCRIARAAGVESEMELTFAGLHQLCAPFLDQLEHLPGPQRDALGTAFGLKAGPAPDRFLVGLAVLSLLSEAAGQQPLMCVVDDAQWLDRATGQALAFAARRLAAGQVAMVFAVRQPGDEPDLAGLPELVVGGLSDGDARALLDSVVPGPLDEQVRDRLVAETRGNPLALLELPRGLTPEELAGGFGLPGAVPLQGRIEESFLRRVRPLPEETRLLLVVAAAEPVGDPTLVWRAAGHLGVTPAAAPSAAATGLIELGGQVRFCHPLARSAVYRAALPEQRQGVHRALAQATDPDADPDRRAWHLAHATPGLDEAVAAELESSAGRARARGGLAAAAAFAERAADLTPDPARRARRALAAAQAKHYAGAPDAALRLLATVQAGPLDELGRAQAQLLYAQLAIGSAHGRDAPLLLLQAAKRLEPLHPGLARETYRDAFYTALTVGRLAVGGGVYQVAQAVQAAPPPPQPSAADLLLDGLAVLTTQGYAAGVPILKRALPAFGAEDVSAEQGLGWLPLACRLCRDLWDDQGCHVLASKLIGLAREAGALTVLPWALLLGVAAELFAGELAVAAALVKEAQAVAEMTGNHVGPYGPLVLAAWGGEEAEVTRLVETVTPEMIARGEGRWLTAAAWAAAVLNNGLGRYDQALAAAERGCEYPAELALATWSMSELIEAAARTGQPQRAAGALDRLSEAASASGTDWALGVQARAGALLSDGDSAERLYREAIDRLGRTRARAELARAHLLYGEWLRRQGRRSDARDQLRAAHNMLTAMGIKGFAERARRELLATGDAALKLMIDAPRELTAQEAQIARLARDGHTNPEIGAQLFISGRTVEWHLRKVFAKLGISSRMQLHQVLPAARNQALSV
jgi:DNA-binding CsgD family transcriptional regulator